VTTPFNTVIVGAVEGDPSRTPNVPLAASLGGTGNTTGTAANVAATLDQVPAAAAAVNLNSQKITSLANGTNATDAMALGQQAQNPGAAANQLLAWSWDPGLNGTNATGTIAIGGTLYLIAFPLLSPVTLNKIWWFNTAAAVTPTSGQSQAGIYNSAGTLVASATAAATATTMVGTNGVNVALSSPYAAAAGTYWVGMVFQAATEPTILRTAGNNGGIANLGITSASQYRVCVNGTGITTALPGSITTSSNTQTGALCYWVGVS
jgi:hypothetical protein